MSQNNSNDKAAMLAKIEGINEVEGFDPTPFAVDYTDLETGEVRKRLPVMIQMAWFRMKYPEGRIAITVIICGWLLHFAMKRSWDNDTPVTRGPATMKAGR